MKEFLTRAFSGVVYAGLFMAALYYESLLVLLLGIFGLLSLLEFCTLINLKSWLPYLVFVILFGAFGFWYDSPKTNNFFGEAAKVLLVITIFVNLLLIKDMFSEKTIPLFASKKFILTTFYLTSAFVFMVMIAHYDDHSSYNPNILLGMFLLMWTNDSFAYLVGKQFGKQKLFSGISPKKTVEGFLGGLFFACIASYFIAHYTALLSFTYWLIIAIIISVFGTLGDLIESKFKRQAKVKDSGVIMPGHGGLLDRLDSIVFATPFIYLFLRIVYYVS